ncbi:sugar transporter [Luteimonas yindakuii]|uniref:Sugar transporter n=1 Tax=Luteimonas yindakuii TaxID=2565782 RepID=A0A4Z1RHG0_9GAMM|nr:sugar transporter [Luteimonas yindakuii]QCO66818.1 sugar transporter [Luteimonas yindakuii]TKS53071.1 sugar transporter [Luteimonas yindakuii]
MATTAMKTPASVWIVGTLALLWNLVGVAAFVMQLAMPAEALQAMPPEQRSVYEATPGWIYLFYGVATIGGVLGAIGLLLRRRWAAPVWLVALVALLLQVVASYAVTPAWTVSGASGLAFPVVLLVIACALWLFARHLAERGVLR